MTYDEQIGYGTWDDWKSDDDGENKENENDESDEDMDV